MIPLLQIIALLVFDTAISWIRMLIGLVISIALGLFIGILANRSDLAERIIIPILDIFQTLPILAFFPIVIYVVVASLPGYIGINAAVIFLIVTSMLWNIAFGVYEAIKELPVEYSEVASISHLNWFEKLRKILIPASMPKVVDQSMLSWSIGLFYLVTSEIFSTGSQNYTVKYGVGSALVSLAFAGDLTSYILGIMIFIAFVVVTRFTLFRYLEKKFIRQEEARRHTGINILSHLLLNRKILSVAKHELSDIKSRLKTVHKFEMYTTNARLVERRRSTIKKPDKLWPRYIAALMISAFILVLLSNPSIANGEYIVLSALIFSLARIWLAFAVIFAVSLPIGVYLVFISKRESAYLLLFQILASIPATILLPIIALSLSGSNYSGELVAFVVFFLSGIWYMIFGIVSTRGALQSNVIEVRNIFGIKGRRAWKYIYSKAVLPGVITGGITAIAAEWNASIVGERFTTNALGSGQVLTSVGTGLGKLLDLALMNGNIQLMIIGLVNLAIVIIIINRVFWKREYRNVMSVYK